MSLTKTKRNHFSVKSNKGASVTEYAILAGLVGIVSVATVLGLGLDVRNAFTQADDILADPQASETTAVAQASDASTLSFPTYPSTPIDTSSCFIGTTGNDTVVGTNGQDCYSLLTGADSFDGTALSFGVNVISDSEIGPLDTLSFGGLNDRFEGLASASLSMGAGDDAVRITIPLNGSGGGGEGEGEGEGGSGPQSAGMTIDMGTGNDVLEYSNADAAIEQITDAIDLGNGNDTASFTCSNGATSQLEITTGAGNKQLFSDGCVGIINRSPYGLPDTMTLSSTNGGGLNAWYPTGATNSNLTMTTTNNASGQILIRAPYSGDIAINSTDARNLFALIQNEGAASATAFSDLDLNVSGNMESFIITTEAARSSWNIDVDTTVRTHIDFIIAQDSIDMIEGMPNLTTTNAQLGIAARGNMTVSFYNDATLVQTIVNPCAGTCLNATTYTRGGAPAINFNRVDVTPTAGGPTVSFPFNSANPSFDVQTVFFRTD